MSYRKNPGGGNIYPPSSAARVDGIVPLTLFRAGGFNPISGRRGCFHPPLRFFGDISETAGATGLKFSDFS